MESSDSGRTESKAHKLLKQCVHLDSKHLLVIFIELFKHRCYGPSLAYPSKLHFLQPMSFPDVDC